MKSSFCKKISEFFLDGAKIIFGSLVVGAFLPEKIGKIPWLTLTGGIVAVLLFLSFSAILENFQRSNSNLESKKSHNRNI